MSEVIQFSPVIAGTMRWGQWGEKFSQSAYETMIDQCVEIGVIDFDHADIYGDYTTEMEFGEVLKMRKDLRQKIRITTKCGIRMPAKLRPDNNLKSYDASSKHIITSVNQSLKNFHTDYIDLLLLHRPDYLLNPEEVAETFHQLKKEGKVHHFGVSNFSVSQTQLLNSYFPLVNHQLEISLSHLDSFTNGDIDFCIQHKIKPTAWSPLGGGLVFGKKTSKTMETTTSQLCEKYNCSIDRLLLAFLIKHPAGIVPVVGTSKILRLVSSLEAYEIKLSSEDWYALWQASTGETIA